MNITETIKTVVDILDKEPNLHLLDCDVGTYPTYIQIILRKPPKERKEVTREDKGFL